MEEENLREENRVLRARVAQLEGVLAGESDPLQRALVEHAEMFLNVVTPEGRFMATVRYSENYGSVVGRSVFEFLEARYHAEVRELFARVAATGVPGSYEAVGYGEDGTPGHTYITRVVPLRQDDVVAALVLVPTDITERVRLERALAEQEQTLRIAVEASRIGLWRWDVGTGEIAWNDRLREIWGVKETPASYETYISLVHPDDRELVNSIVKEAMETGGYRSFEHRVLGSADRGERWLLAAGTVQRDAQGKPIGLLGGALDITEQKRLAAHQERAARVESIGQLTAGIAHNFNNLLAVIVPNLELALSGKGVAHTELTAALSASLQARDLVRNLLSLTRRGDARSLAPAEPNDVVTRVVSICRTTFPREITLRQSLPAERLHVTMPAGDLEQALLNLLFNARDAFEHVTERAREVDVTVAHVRDDNGARCVELSVADNGSGMTDETRERVFQPFFTTKPPHKGSGLGLASAAEHVRQAGGSIQCRTQLGVGTTFSIRLPTTDVVAPTPAVATPSVATAATPAESILLVDDEPLVRGVMRRLLERDGYKVLEAASAQEARDVLQVAGASLALVILDQSMPRETGTQALASLKALTKAPFVLFSGMAPDLPPGIVAVLDKPARPEELQRVVRSAINSAR